MNQKDLLLSLDRQAIMASIEWAEAACSGEVRVHVEPKLRWELREYAERTFERLGMTKTAARNGVLIFIAAHEQQFVILGDRGIHERVGEDFWRETAAIMETHFKKGEFTEGIVEAVHTVGQKLHQFFPGSATDANELENGVSVGDQTHDENSMKNEE